MENETFITLDENKINESIDELNKEEMNDLMKFLSSNFQKLTKEIKKNREEIKINSGEIQKIKKDINNIVSKNNLKR